MITPTRHSLFCSAQEIIVPVVSLTIAITSTSMSYKLSDV